MNRKSPAQVYSHFAATFFVAASCWASSSAFAEPRVAESVTTDHGSLSSAPVMAIVSIKHQRISLYDAEGRAMRALTSSGAKEYETPVGIYSILQKNKDHYSNLYDDAAMPFMQRITWSGIALHEGQLPGYPASHGCVRMPGSFASEIFPLTKIGMRVIVARDNVAPVDITHANLLKPAPLNGSAVVTRTAYEVDQSEDQSPRPFVPDLRRWPERQSEMDALQAIVAEKNSEAEMSKGPVAERKDIMTEKAKARASVGKTLRAAEKLKRSAEEKAASAERALAYARDPARWKPLETAKAKAEAAVLTAMERLAQANEAVSSAPNDRARARAERSLRALDRAKQSAIGQAARIERELTNAKLPARYKKQEDAAAKAAATARIAAQKFADASAAVQAAEAALQTATQDHAAAVTALEAAVAAAAEARRKTLPVSLFISRKTQRLYVRQGHEPVVDIPITISEPDTPIGTHVFTAVDYENGANALRWTAVSMAPRPGREQAQLSSKSRTIKDAAAEPFLTDRAIASSVLDRVSIPPEIIDRVSASVWPGSSLIVSDEPLHKETNNATDFIVLISGEPQGGIKHRPKPPPVRKYYEEDYWDERPYNTAYDRYGRRMRVIQKKKPLFSWW